MENVCFCSLLYSENCVFCRITAHRTIHCSIMFLIHFMMFMTLSSQLLFVKLIKYAAWCNLWPFMKVWDQPLRITLYLASLNFFIWLGLSWFLRRRNHLWICLSENPVFLPKLSTSPCRVTENTKGQLMVKYELWSICTHKRLSENWNAACIYSFNRCINPKQLAMQMRKHSKEKITLLGQCKICWFVPVWDFYLWFWSTIPAQSCAPPSLWLSPLRPKLQPDERPQS